MAKKISTPKTRKKLAAIYCRVSTFDQNRGDYSSLEDQEQRLRRAAEEDGYEVFQVFKEVASSASLDREELGKMLGKLDQIDAIYVTKLDRLSRSMSDWCRINELLDEHDCALVSVTQKIDTTTTMGRFFRDLLMLFAQFEREMIAERTYEKMAEQAKKGRWSGGHPIHGYDAVEKKLIVNKDQAKLVDAIYDKYLEVASISRTARWANDNGHKTKGVRYSNGREVKPRKFTRADIQRMLSNITYIGKVRFDDMEFDGEHEGIIDEKKFIEVQKLMEARKEKPRRGDQSQQDTLLLGLLRCGYCGCAYTTSFVNKKMKDGSTQRYYYYKCTTKSKKDAAACCGADLKADVIDTAVVQYIKELAKKPEHLTAVIAAATEANRDGVKSLESERTKLSKDLSKLEKTSLALVDRLADPSLQAITAIIDRLAALEKDQQSLKSRITELTLQIRDRRDGDISTEEVRTAYADFSGLWDELGFDERQYALRLLVKQINLNFEKKEQSGEIQIEAWGRRPTPLRVSLEKARNGKLRNQDGRLPRLDSNQRQAD
ncbi:recombinase family protein [Neorhodopirellula pilleata]|uniref:recombinase family protein n=1 Tax=Neorhodopirellula pilleata TaxID=2714738 RepID=UPI0011B52348|nr:recombinase family protein [Neorhodopirellula pilleata]